MKTNYIKKYRTTRGFTVLELLTGLAVMAILFGWGFPSLQMMIQNNQVSAQNSELISVLHFAKTEAVRRNANVPVLLGPNETDDGWVAIVEDPAELADIEGCEPGQLRCASYNRVTIDLDLPGDDTALTFNNRGYITDPDNPLSFLTGTIFLQHEHCSGDRQRRRIEITATGQIDSCDVACNDDATEC